MRWAFLVLLSAWATLSLPVTAQLSRYRADFALSRQNFVDTVSIEWDRGQVYVPVEIAGRQLRFLFDTGASQTVVFSDTPISGMTEAGQIVSHDAIGHTDTVQMVVLPPLRVGSLTLTGCQSTLQRRQVKRQHLDGILGFDIVNRGLSVKIDVRQHLLIITDRKDFFAGEAGYDLRYRLNYHVPYVRVNPFGRYREETLFDTGSRQLYAMNKASFDQAYTRCGAAADSQVEGRATGRHAIGHGGVEPRGEVVFLGLSALRLGDLTLTGVHTVTTQGGSHLGAALLDHCAVVFSPRRKLMRLVPYGGEAVTAIDNRQMEIAFVHENDRPVVGLVWEQGVPYRQGFREGDTIEQIDGKEVRSMAQFTAWGFERGREHSFIVRDRRGFRREVKWVRLPVDKQQTKE